MFKGEKRHSFTGAECIQNKIQLLRPKHIASY